MIDLLYFNGINGATGSYGLEPMTAKSLSNQILGAKFAELDKLKELEAKLKRGTVNRKKVLQIVEMLAQRAVKDPGKKAVSQNEWLEALAKELFTLIVGDKATEPGHIKELETKLKQDAVDTILLIATLLAESKARELSALLLAKELTYRKSDSARVTPQTWEAATMFCNETGYAH
jgi:hypothetical protein